MDAGREEGVGRCSDLFEQSAFDRRTIQKKTCSVPLEDSIYDIVRFNRPCHYGKLTTWKEYVHIKYTEIDNERPVHADVTGSNSTGELGLYQHFTVLSKSITTNTAVTE